MSHAPGGINTAEPNRRRAQRRFNGHRAVSSAAAQYWQYSQQCARQAVEAEEPRQRDRLLDLARLWTEAALREELHCKTLMRQSTVGR
jgi:hypothetical protein